MEQLQLSSSAAQLVSHPVALTRAQMFVCCRVFLSACGFLFVEQEVFPCCLLFLFDQQNSEPLLILWGGVGGANGPGMSLVTEHVSIRSQ